MKTSSLHDASRGLKKYCHTHLPLAVSAFFFAGAYVALYFYKNDLSLEERTDSLGNALCLLLMTNVLMFFRLLKRSG